MHVPTPTDIVLRYNRESCYIVSYLLIKKINRKLIF